MIIWSGGSRAGSWPERQEPLASLREGLETVCSGLSLIVLAPVLAAMIAFLILHQRYACGRSWGSILGRD